LLVACSLFRNPRPALGPLLGLFYFFLIGTAFSTVANSLLWIAYALNADSSWFSYTALASILVLLSLVAIMTYAILKPPQDGEGRPLGKFVTNLRVGVARVPYWALVFFFTVFLGVTYLFAFAFAFHDKDLQKHGSVALLMAQLPMLHALPHSGRTPASRPDAWLDARLTPATVFAGQLAEYKFLFGVEDAILRTETCLPPADATATAPGPTGGRPECKPLTELLVTVRAALLRGDRVRLVLRGSADSRGKDLGRKYSSDYELSEARAQNVRYALLAAFEKDKDIARIASRQVEWLVWPVSQENVAATIPPERSVVVLVTATHDPHPFVALTLMDYVYFSTYTITTTGYGDIVPTTTYAKFLCTLANLVEVFFLVVFFNALLSVRHVEAVSAQPLPASAPQTLLASNPDEAAKQGVYSAAQEQPK
jgi:hypothetical protein